MRTRWILAPLALLAACAPSGSDDDPQVGGESHWLRLCEEDAACQDGESCQCGVCARPLEGGAAWVRGARDAGDTAEGCVDPGEGSGPHCEAGPAEVYAVIEGDEVVARFCAPNGEGAASLAEREGERDGENDEHGEGALRLGNEDNKATFTLGEERASGPVTLAGARVTLLGQGADVSVISGDVRLEGNSARLLRVTVEGDLEIEGNGAALAEVRVNGEVKVKGNNAILLAVEILGPLKVEGNNTALFGVGVAGEARFERDAAQCVGCYSFEDRDQDGRPSEAERGEPLCR